MNAVAATMIILLFATVRLNRVFQFMYALSLRYRRCADWVAPTSVVLEKKNTVGWTYLQPRDAESRRFTSSGGSVTQIALYRTETMRCP